MTSFVEIDGKKFQTAKDAASLSGYSRDYISRLAREKKIDAHQVGRQWFVSLDSLSDYVRAAEQESQARQLKLSEERRRERAGSVENRPKEKHASVKSSRPTRPKFVAVAVLTLGIGLGVALNTTPLLQQPSQGQVARVAQEEVFPHVQKTFPIATGDVEESSVVETINFSEESMTITTLDGGGHGVMLLPHVQGGEITDKDVKAMFSDAVHLVHDVDGTRYVVRTRADGSQERLPFAVVPVTNKETP